MPVQQGQTDSVLKITLPSAMLWARWLEEECSLNGDAGLEVFTNYVGDGAPIKATIKDLQGKTLTTIEGKVMSNLFRTRYKPAAGNTTGGMTFEAELPKHGLKRVSGMIRVYPPVEFSALKFLDDKGKALTEMPEGIVATCEAKVKGLLEGARVNVVVAILMRKDAKDGITAIDAEAPVKHGKVSLLFDTKLTVPLDAIRIQLELAKEGGSYFQPAMIFTCRARGVQASCEPLKVVQSMVLKFERFPGEAGDLEGKKITLIAPDGKKEEKTIPMDGKVDLPKTLPGRYKVEGDLTKELKEAAPEPKKEKEATEEILTRLQLKDVSGASLALVDKFLADLQAEMTANAMTTGLRKSHFLSQVCHESGNLRYTEEIASGEAYEGRTTLGNTQKGDGVRFKGRGLIQLTGRTNYEKFGAHAGEDFTEGENPKKVAETKYAVKSAFWFWCINRKLDRFADDNNYLEITFRVNGGFNGVDPRLVALKKAFKAFKVDGAEDKLKNICDDIIAKVKKVDPLFQAEAKTDTPPDEKDYKGKPKEYKKALDSWKRGILKKLTDDGKITKLEGRLYFTLDTAQKAEDLKTKITAKK